MNAQKVPKTEKDLREFAGSVLARLVDSHNEESQFVDFLASETGLMYRCAGSVSILLLVNGFPELAAESQWQEVVIKEFSKIIAHVRENGFDASPRVLAKSTTAIFSPKAKKRFHYLDSVSFVLSTAVLIRFSCRRGILTLDSKLNNATIEMIRETLEIVCRSACKLGGWGFTEGCSQPDLYYSYAVSESLADFGDYIMGETPEVADADTDLQRLLGDKLIQDVSEARKSTSLWLIKTYLPSLGIEMINPLGQDLQDPILLYYTYFVIDMLIVCNADIFFSKKQRDIMRSIEHAIYLTRIVFDRAYDNENWWNDVEKSSLKLRWENNPELAKTLTRMQLPALYEPGLVPLSLRCNCLYAYYFTKGFDQKINDLFTIVFNDRQPDGLWDSVNYELMVT